MNVTELYRELKMTKEEFFPLVQELGFDIGERAIKIDDRVALQIIDAIKKKHRDERKKSIFSAADEEVVAPQEKERGAAIELPEKITVKAFAQLLNKSVPDLIAILMRNGIMATINEALDYETAAIIAEDMGFTPTQSTSVEQQDVPQERVNIIEEALRQEDPKTLQQRPPVIVIMGHVDHGKTTLLDTIRKTNVTAGEAGGITQHIGAYQVEDNGRLLTFIDTPGHEAFTAMRSRGARVADVAILVVAADDGIKPQTLEAIHILQDAKLPFVVAINKIDKPDADVTRVKKELSDIHLIPEDYGGKTVTVGVSAKDGQNIAELLDTVLLLADLEKDRVRANPAGKTVGTIIESHVDTHKGPVATVLVQNGTLRIGDIAQIGSIPGKVRSLKDWQGHDVKEAAPAMPVQVLGLKKAPVVGDVLEVVTDKKMLRMKVKEYESFAFLRARTEKEEGKKQKLNLVVRADTLGSLEAIIESLQNMTHAEVKITILHKGLGGITENDIALAESAHALVIGFNVEQTSGAEKYSRDHSVRVRIFHIIYELLDTVKEELGALLTKKVTFERVGVLKVLAVFRKEPTYTIIGGKVDDGKIVKNAPLKILRGTEMIGEGMLSQLQMEKKNVGDVIAGHECGLRVDTETAIAVGDRIEAYEERETTRTL